MSSAGAARTRLTQALNQAYAYGLLSDDTFAWRLNRVLSEPLLQLEELVGDIRLPSAGMAGLCQRLTQTVATVAGRLDGLFSSAEPPMLLALDWTADGGELLLGRSSHCDLRLEETSVSRRHARLWCQQGRWLLQDLSSTNGTFVNSRRVGRCQLRPGDLLSLGEAQLRVD